METVPAHDSAGVPLDDGAAKATAREMSRLALLISAGWLGTNLGLAIADLPLKFMLKDGLHLGPGAVALFLAAGQFTNYIKPIAGLLTDSVPLLGTRRRHYLLWSLFGTGAFFLLLSIVPRRYDAMLLTYTLLYTTVVFTSTTLGGVMVEAGTRFRAAGRLTAQRIGMFRLGSLLGGPIGGFLSAHFPFYVCMAAAAALHLVLVPLFYFALREARTARMETAVLREAGRQLRQLGRSRTLLSAAGMVFLVAAAPGFGTPLFFHQTDTLHFSKPFIGTLVLVAAAFGLLAATFYYRACRTLNLRTLLAGGIIADALGALTYLTYRDANSALVVTAITGFTSALTLLPIYDLAVRATPVGSEALGYSVMMSVWNFTNAFFDWVGAQLFDHYKLTFMHLVWINAGTTALVLLAVPLLPAVLMLRRDGAPAETSPA